MLREGCQPGDAGCAGTGTEAEGQAEVSVHPVSPLAPATLVPFGLMGSRSCWECCETAQPLLPIPSSRDAPAVMVSPYVPGYPAACGAGRCLNSPVSCSAEAPGTHLCPGRESAQWVHDGKSVSQCRGWEEASCLPWHDSGQPGWEEESAQGSRSISTGPLLLHFLLTWELPEMGPPCSSVPAGVNWIWRSH